jgi:hypothetical protein
LQHLLATASPEDYVLFKLDIDTNEVEEAIVRSLLARQVPNMTELKLVTVVSMKIGIALKRRRKLNRYMKVWLACTILMQPRSVGAD